MKSVLEYFTRVSKRRRCQIRTFQSTSESAYIMSLQQHISLIITNTVTTSYIQQLKKKKQ